MNNEKLSSEDSFRIFLPEDLHSLPEDGVPFIAAYSLPEETMRWVIMQNEEMNGMKVMFVHYREEGEDAYQLSLHDADLLVYWNEDKGWTDGDGNVTSDTEAVGAIIGTLLNGNGGEEWIVDDEVNPLAEFEGFYVITKDDGSYPILYEVTIKGDMPDEGSQIGYYTVVYSDGNTKIIDWKEDKPHWMERGIGVTAHSLSVGTLIEKHFEPKE